MSLSRDAAVFTELFEMRLDGDARGRKKTGVEARIDAGHERIRIGDAVGNRGKHLLFAHFAVFEVVVDQRNRRVDDGSVTGEHARRHERRDPTQ